MLNYNFTTKILGLKDAIIKNYEDDGLLAQVYYEYPKRAHKCPRCGYITSLVHDYRERKIKDIPIQGKQTIMYYNQRRYRCGLCEKRFSETQPIVPKYRQISARLVYYVMLLLEEKRSMSDIGKALNISITTINKILDMTIRGKPKGLPLVLSIDEFKGDTNGEKFQCILTDPVHKKIIDILPNRSSTTIIDYIKGFNNRNNVQYFIMDMNRAYLDVAKTFLPNAKIIIDKFHVVRYNTWAFENVRRKVQTNLPPELRKYFKRSRRLLLSRMNNLSDKNKQAVNVMLGLSDELTDAYLLKELFYQFIDSTTSKVAMTKLEEFIIHAKLKDIPEYERCLTMLNNWKPYILNAFDHNYTNGYTEGINNKIKVIKRIAFGFKTFNNIRNRVLITN